MKKTVIKVLGVLFIIIVILVGIYLNRLAKENEIKKQNKDYEFFYNKEVFGTEIATVVNKAVDQNERNEIPKDENGKYIQNDTNSIKIVIHIKDTETLYDMETLYNGTMTTFAQYYNSIKFKCTDITYNKEKKVNYMYFEQITE